MCWYGTRKYISSLAALISPSRISVSHENHSFLDSIRFVISNLFLIVKSLNGIAKVSGKRKVWVALAVIVFTELMGCMNLIPFPRSSAPGTDFIQKAIAENDWAQAYMLLEPHLVTRNLVERYKANQLLAQYPPIRDAANDSFSVANLENFHRINQQVSPFVQWERLTIYRRTVATPEMYFEALQNYRKVFGDEQARRIEASSQRIYDLARVHDIIDNELAKELHDALDNGRLSIDGKMTDLLQVLQLGKTSRRDVLALLGQPSGRFEFNTILTWPIRADGDVYHILPGFVRSLEGVTHSLIVIFDQNRIIESRTIVRVTE